MSSRQTDERRRRVVDLAPAAAAVASLVVPLLLFLPASADAFCGSYVSGGSAELFNNATQVVMMRHKQTTVLSMQNNYEGPTDDFAMIVPTPEVLQKENVKTIEEGVFDRIDTLTAPRLVEYWEQDPCAGTRDYGAGGSSGGFGGADAAAVAADTGGGGSVSVEAKFSEGEYDIVVLKSDESTALEEWLRNNNYNIPQGASTYLEPYIQQGSYFFVAKVDSKKVEFKNGEAVLSPLRFNYESGNFKLPVRLGLINSKGKQDLIVNVLAQDQRYEVANYPSVTIPTNIEVVSTVKNYFATFYRELFKETLKKHRANGKNPVVTEYAWNAGSCDPCPTGTVSADDLFTLGADIMSKKYGSDTTYDDAGISGPSPEFRRGWVVTRLHTRYGKNELGADLVFEEADAITGGRNSTTTDDGELSHDAQSASRNNFQGRYIIRHKWDGPVDCENPDYGNWGGKNGYGSPSPTTAKGETNRQEDDSDSEEKVELEREIREDIASIDVTANPKEQDDDVHWDGTGGGTGGSDNSGAGGGSDADTGGACSTIPGRTPAVPFGLVVALGGWLVLRLRRD